MSSCKEEDNILEYTGDSFYRFATESGSVSEDAAEAIAVEVFYSIPGGGSGSVDFSLGGDLVAGSDYTILNSSNSLSFNEANGYKDVINIQPINNEDVSTSPRIITIALANATGGSIGFPGPDALSSTYALTIIEDDCPSELAGMYDVTTTYGHHDFLPDYNSNTTTAEIVEVSPGVYEIFDFSGGLYSTGPYADAYDTTNLTAQFTDVCNDISWEGQSDPWGEMTPLENGVNSVDPSTGVITLSWFCAGYGENGVSVYTPQ